MRKREENLKKKHNNVYYNCLNSGTQVHKHSIETNRQGIFVSFFPYKYALSEALGKLSFAQYQWRKYKQKNVVCVYI